MTEPHILLDAKGNATHAVLTIDDFRRLIDAAEMAADIAAYDAVKARLASGEEEFLPHAVAVDLVAGKNPVRVYRQHRGFTATALAAAAGINRSYLSQVETGRRPASLKTLQALAKALDVRAEDLIPAQPADDAEDTAV